MLNANPTTAPDDAIPAIVRLPERTPDLPTAAEVKEAARLAAEAQATYRDAQASYKAQADTLTLLRERAASIGPYEAGKARESLVARAVSAVGDYLTGKAASPLPTGKEIETAAADDVRAEIIDKMRSEAGKTIAAHELATAHALVEMSEAHDAAVYLHIRHVIAHALLRMADDAAAVSATVAAFGTDAGMDWNVLSRIWPAGNAAPILGKLPANPETGEALVLEDARRIIAAHEASEREARNAAARATMEASQQGPQYHTGEAARAMLANMGSAKAR